MSVEEIETENVPQNTQPEFIYLKLVSGENVIGKIKSMAYLIESMNNHSFVDLYDVMQVRKYTMMEKTGKPIEDLVLFSQWVEANSLNMHCIIPTDTIILVVEPDDEFASQYVEAVRAQTMKNISKVIATKIRRKMEESLQGQEKDYPAIDLNSFVSLGTTEKKPELLTPELLQEAEYNNDIEYPQEEDKESTSYKTNGQTVH